MPKAARSLEVVRRAGQLFDWPRGLMSCFNAHVCSAESIMPPCGCRRRSLIWVRWIVLFAVRRGCARVSFVAWGTEGRLVSFVCSMRFVTEWTTLSMSI